MHVMIPLLYRNVQYYPISYSSKNKALLSPGSLPPRPPPPPMQSHSPTCVAL
jgi:hypothetical protein